VWLAGGVRWSLTPTVGLGDLAAALWFYVAVAVNEELITRGYPFQRLVQGLGAPWGLAIFAAIFALLHWANPGMVGATRAWATLTIALSAVLLGLAYLRTGSLALPMGIHLGWNWVQGSLLGFGVSGTADFPGLLTPVFAGKPTWVTGGAFGLEASLPGAVVCLLATLALGFWKGTATRLSGGVSTAWGS
jgi:membrane protease YdiL (CAAX protease family)